MATIELEAYVTEDGEVKFRLSPNEKKKPSHIKIKLGNVELEIEGDLENMQSQYLRTSTEFETGGDLENPPSVENDVAWTDEEIAEMMRSEPKTGAEIADSDVIGSWADKGIIDSVEFVEYLRRKSRERRKWQRD